MEPSFLLLLLWTAVTGVAAELCEQNDVINSAIDPHLSVVYAAGQEFCIEPVTQEGTVVAVLECLLDHPGRATLTGYNSSAYHLHSAQNGSATLFYLTTRPHGTPGEPTSDQINLSCLLCSVSSNSVVVNVTHCSEGTQSAAPYVLGVPPTSTVRITEDQSTDVALFNVIANTLWTEAGVSISVNTFYTIKDYIPLTQNDQQQNDTAVSTSKQVPFYVSEGNVIFFNSSQPMEMDTNTTYELVIAASDNHTGAVTWVHTSVAVFKTVEAGPGIASSHLPSVTVNTTASCVTIESQPGQLLATVECSPTNNVIDLDQTLVVSLTPITTTGIAYLERAMFTDDLTLQVERDHNKADISYITIHRVSLNIPDATESTAPAYSVYVLCSDGITVTTNQQPVQFCVKHNKLFTEYNAEQQTFSLETTTPYFTNAPLVYYVPYDPDTSDNFDGLMFNVGVQTYETEVRYPTSTEAGSSVPVNTTDTVITADDITSNYGLYCLSSDCSPFLTGYNVIPNNLGLTAVDILLYFTSKEADKGNVELQSVYDLVLFVRPKKKHVGSAEVKITVYIQKGPSNLGSSNRFFHLDFVTTVAEVNLNLRAPRGTLITATQCVGGYGGAPSDIVTRVNTIFEDESKDSVLLSVKASQRSPDKFYLVMSDLWDIGHQYFLLNCTDGVSSITKRITVTTTRDDSVSSPYFYRIEEPPYQIVVNLSGNDTEIVQLSTEPIDSIQSLQIATSITPSVPFYIGVDGVLVVNVSEARNQGVNEPFDVVLSVSSPDEEYYGYLHAAVQLEEEVTQPPPTIEELSPITPDNTAAVAGGVTAGVVAIAAAVLAAAVVCVCIITKRRHRHKTARSLSVVRMVSDLAFNSYDTIQLNLTDEWSVAWNNVSLGKKIGEGEFSTVYRGLITNEGIPQPRQEHFAGISVIPIAVKLLKARLSHGELNAFYDEIALMKKVSIDNNPHIVKLIGCVTNQSPMAILLEYAAHGDLLHYLRVMRKFDQSAAASAADHELSQSEMDGETEQELEAGDLMSFAQQIASGMEYLAGISVVHRDLACRNVLVADGKILKITDFGLSKNTDLYVSSLSGKLPIRWMAPESIRERLFTEKSDVWSYGITLWEICTLGAIPYPDLSNQEVVTKVLAGYRMKRPSNCSEKIFNIMSNCWQQLPKDRLTFAAIHQTLRKYMQNENTSNYIRMSEVESYPTEVDEEETTMENKGTLELSTVEEVFA